MHFVFTLYKNIQKYLFNCYWYY